MHIAERLARAAVDVLGDGGHQDRVKKMAQAFLAHEVTAHEFIEVLELLPIADYRQVRQAAQI